MSAYKTPSGWRIDVRTARRGEKHNRITRTFPTKAKADAFERDLHRQIEIARGAGTTLPDASTLETLLKEWWEDKEETFAPSNRDCVRLRKERWQRSTIGPLPIRDLTRKHLKGWINERRAHGRADNTIRNDLSILSNLYKWLKDEHDMEIHDPVSPLMKRLGHSRKRSRRLSPDEIERLESALEQIAQAYRNRDIKREGDPRYALDIEFDNHKVLRLGCTPNLLYLPAAARAAVECAMRRTRLFSLTWNQINFEDRVIEIQETGPDNKKLPSLIPMTKRLVAIFKAIHGPARIGAALDEPVFGPLNGDRAYRYLKSVCKALGIPDFRWHDWRHEACSRLADAGWNPLQIQKVSGHRSLQSLERYTHPDVQPILDLMDRTGT